MWQIVRNVIELEQMLGLPCALAACGYLGWRLRRLERQLGAVVSRTSTTLERIEARREAVPVVRRVSPDPIMCTLQPVGR